MVDDYCKGCFYRVLLPALGGYGCEYICITEKRRPCPSGTGCTVKLEKNRAGTKNAEQRKTILAVEAMTDEEKEVRRQRYLEKKRQKNKEYYAAHKQELNYKTKIKRQAKKQQPGKRSIGAHDRKKITAEHTRAFWQGRQTQAIKDWKIAHGVTYEQMAELLEVEPSTILMWVYENNTANWDKLQKIGIEKPVIPPKIDATIDKPVKTDKI